MNSFKVCSLSRVDLIVIQQNTLGFPDILITRGLITGLITNSVLRSQRVISTISVEIFHNQLSLFQCSTCLRYVVHDAVMMWSTSDQNRLDLPPHFPMHAC